MSRRIVESSRRAILVADSLKYGRSAPVRICAENHVALDIAVEKADEADAGAR